ncbi:hypothetical protein [Cellulomonas marina]|uniref:hypothetical protein n=1 Tax=Cellulomonas marina TaxID=988821 RepID=UPI00111341C9|nr:hypothetical protein [Cellulomonas marina]
MSASTTFNLVAVPSEPTTATTLSRDSLEVWGQTYAQIISGRAMRSALESDVGEGSAAEISAQWVPDTTLIDVEVEARTIDSAAEVIAALEDAVNGQLQTSLGGAPASPLPYVLTVAEPAGEPRTTRSAAITVLYGGVAAGSIAAAICYLLWRRSQQA